MTDKVIKVAFNGTITAKQLFSELLNDETIEDAVVVVKKKDASDGEYYFVCEATSMTLADLCISEKTLSVTVSRAFMQEFGSVQGITQ